MTFESLRNQTATMRTFSSLILTILAALCLSFSTTSAFVARPTLISPPTATSVTPAEITSTSLNVFGTKKSKAQKEAEAEKAAMYWEGEWVCKDCGYIYQRVSKLQFICPIVTVSEIFSHFTTFKSCYNVVILIMLIDPSA